MNYYDHHIGDYDEATAHLTACEDGIYSRMIRKYYATEKPLIADVPKLQRLLRAKTREEKSAVLSVLEEFFHLEDDGWHQDRCDSAIEKFISSEPEREVKKANEDNRTKRHREERASLFKQLTDAGHHAAWNIGITELRQLVSRVCGTPVAPSSNGPVTQPVTAPATLVTATQSPITNHQSPVLKPKGLNPAPDDSPSASAVGSLCIAMRSAGVDVQPADPRMIALAAQGVPPETAAAACAEAKKSKPGERITAGYVLAILSRWSTQAANLDVGGAAQPRASPGYQTPNEKAKDWADRLTGRAKNEPGINELIDINERPA